MAMIFLLIIPAGIIILTGLLNIFGSKSWFDLDKSGKRAFSKNAPKSVILLFNLAPFSAMAIILYLLMNSL